MKEVFLTVCMTAIVSGLFKMLVPEGKFKSQISFLISCLFAVCVLKAVSGGLDIGSFEFSFEDADIVDFDDKLSENAEKAAAYAVRDKVNELLAENKTPCSQIYIVAHIDGSFGISINEIELVFEKNTSEPYIQSALDAVREEVGDEIIVRYSYN
ncbi:MAG: hypothetical protein J1E39_00350 [Eubacterium sp.]|nr:hypothetical protein [Eubacterium sp.]